MSKVAKFLLRPQVNLAGAALSALAGIASWFTAVDDAYRVTPLAFILCVVFLVLFALHEHLSAERLRSQASPTLKLVLQEGQLYDSLHVDETLRIFRVGIRSSGASAAEVAVKVTRVLPELPRMFPMQELQQTHEPEGTSRFAVNKSDEPLVFVDLVHQKIHANDGKVSGTKDGKPYVKYFKKGSTAGMWFPFASGSRDIPLGEERYLVWVAIDGPGAEGTRKVVLRLNKSGQYDLSKAYPWV